MLSALVSVAYVLALACYHLVISRVSWSYCLWLWLVPPARLCISTPRSVHSIRSLGAGSAQRCRRNQKDPVPGCSLVLLSWWLWVGPSWARNLSRSVGLTYAHRCVCTSGRLALFWWYLGMELCDTGSALGTDGNQKAVIQIFKGISLWCEWSYILCTSQCTLVDSKYSLSLSLSLSLSPSSLPPPSLSLFFSEEQRGLFFSGSMILLTNLLLWLFLWTMAHHMSHWKTLGSMTLMVAWPLLSWEGSSCCWTAKDRHVKEIQYGVRFCR